MVASFEIPLGTIRGSLSGILPSVIATCSPDGVPNVTYLSVVLYVDDGRIALSNQFISKTLANLEANPQVAIRVVDPATMYDYDIDAHHIGSEASGELFDSMRVQIEAVAAQTGIESDFTPRNVEILQVDGCRSAAGVKQHYRGHRREDRPRRAKAGS